jgi:hypothetical protein
MNTESAKKATEFAEIVRYDQDAVIVKVPGHNGRSYFVRVTEQTVTCKRSKKDGGYNCPSIGSGSVCYHSLAAWEAVHGPVVAWCDSEKVAKKIENLGNHTIEIRSTQNGRAKAWAVKKGKPIDEEARQAAIQAIARDYLRIFTTVQAGQSVTPEEHERLRECRRQMGILKITHADAQRMAHGESA